MVEPDRNGDGRAATQAILERRAAWLARSLHTEEVADTVELVVMSLGPERYGVVAQGVHEVLACPEITPVPGAPALWRGVVNLRGSLHAVIDLGRYLSLPSDERVAGGASVVLVSGAALTIGLAVDGVAEVRRLPTAAIGTLAGTSEVARDFVQGVTDDLLTVLDLEALLSNPTLVVREELT